MKANEGDTYPLSTRRTNPMTKNEVKELASCEVYQDLKDGRHDTICVCGGPNGLNKAMYIAKMLAEKDKDGSPYYVIPIEDKDVFIPGGGWQYTFKKDKDGVVRMSSME